MLKLQKDENIITHDIQIKANEITNASKKTSLESKRIKFQKYIEEYYSEFTGDSEVLIARLNDIDFYKSTSKDLSASVMIGILTSTMVSIIFYSLDDFNKVYGIIATLVIYIIMGIIICVSVFWLLKFIEEIFKNRKKLSAYEKLYCEKYEKEIIENILEERLKQANKAMLDKKN